MLRRLALIAYRALCAIAWGFAIIPLLYLSTKPKYRQSIPARFFPFRSLVLSISSSKSSTQAPRHAGFCEGFAPELWFHACSFGEVKSLEPIITALDSGANFTKDSALESTPQAPDPQNPAGINSSSSALARTPILLTTTTQTGFALARQTYASMPHIRVEYLPFELFLPLLHLPHHKKHFANLRTLIVTEAELWLELFHTAKALGAKTLLINARISTRSYPKYRRFRAFYRLLFSYVDEVFAQSSADAARLAELGASQIQTLGNLKTLSPITCSTHYKKPSRLTIIAASTHKGEEELILQAFGALLDSSPESSATISLAHDSTKSPAHDSAPLLILAPRHPERFSEVGALLDSSAFSFMRFSQGALAHCSSDTQVILLDTLGELINCYAIADIVILGGAFVPAGGHNPLEPAFFHTKLISGRHIFNQEALFACIEGYTICEDLAELVAALLAHEHLPTSQYKPMQASRATLLQTITSNKKDSHGKSLQTPKPETQSLP